jgi:hypothetical protein
MKSNSKKFKNSISKKGFILTSDSFLGFTVLALVSLLALSYLSQINIDAWNNVDLINSARDLAIVLEEKDVLKDTISQQSSELLLETINSTQNSYCFEVSLYESSESLPDIIAVKSACTKDFTELIVINRSFVIDSNTTITNYYAKIEAWYK